MEVGTRAYILPWTPSWAQYTPTLYRVAPCPSLYSGTGPLHATDWAGAVRCAQNNNNFCTPSVQMREGLPRTRENFTYPQRKQTVFLSSYFLSNLIGRFVSRDVVILNRKAVGYQEEGGCSKFELMIEITMRDPPQLTPKQIHSPDLCDFVNRLVPFWNISYFPPL